MCLLSAPNASTTAEDGEDSEDSSGENSKILDSLLVSIKNIAKSIEGVEVREGGKRANQGAVIYDNTSSGRETGVDAHWSQSLVKAANFLVDRINNNPSAGDNRVHPVQPVDLPETGGPRSRRDGSAARFYHHEDPSIKEKLAARHDPSSRGRRAVRRTATNPPPEDERADHTNGNGHYNTLGTRKPPSMKPPVGSSEKMGGGMRKSVSIESKS